MTVTYPNFGYNQFSGTQYNATSSLGEQMGFLKPTPSEERIKKLKKKIEDAKFILQLAKSDEQKNRLNGDIARWEREIKGLSLSAKSERQLENMITSEMQNLANSSGQEDALNPEENGDGAHINCTT